MNKKYLLASILALGVSQAHAGQSNKNIEGDDNQVMAGLMMMTNQSIYVGGDDQSRVIPFFNIKWGNFYLQGPTVGYNLYQTDKSTFSAGIELDGIFNDDRDDSAILADMKKLDSVFSASLNYDYKTDFGEFGVSVKSDVSDGHGGYSADLSYSYPIRAMGWMVKPKFSVEWVSEDVNQYWYGVSAEDVKANRPLYTPDAGVNYNLGLTAIYPFGEHHSIMLMANYTAYSSEVSDSPIVDADNASSVALGYVYRF